MLLFLVSLELQRFEQHLPRGNVARRIQQRTVVSEHRRHESTALTSGPIYAPACSTSSKKCRCCSRSTSRSRNSDRRNAAARPSDSSTNGMSSRRSTARPGGSVSVTQMHPSGNGITTGEYDIPRRAGIYLQNQLNGSCFHLFYYCP